MQVLKTARLHKPDAGFGFGSTWVTQRWLYCHPRAQGGIENVYSFISSTIHEKSVPWRCHALSGFLDALRRADVEPFILISIYLGGLVQWVIIHLNLIKSAFWVLWLRISRLKEEVEVRGRHVPPLIDGPVHGSPQRYLHLIWVNDLHWLQESAVTNAGMGLRLSAFTNAYFSNLFLLMDAVLFKLLPTLS